MPAPLEEDSSTAQHSLKEQPNGAGIASTARYGARGWAITSHLHLLSDSRFDLLNLGYQLSSELEPGLSNVLCSELLLGRHSAAQL